MKLSLIAAEGFRGIRDPLFVELSESFVVLTGRNGSGKSTLFDLIEFALTGCLRRQEGETERNERIEQYYWWKGPDSPDRSYVKLGLLDDEGEEWIIERTPSGYKGPSETELRRLLTQGKAAPADFLTKLLATAIIRDEEITRFSVDLSEAERFSFVRAAIGEPTLTHYISTVNDVCQRLNKRVKTLKAQQEEHSTDLSSLMERVAELRSVPANEEDLAEARTVIASLIPSWVERQDFALAREHLADRRQATDRALELAEQISEVREKLQEASSEGVQDRLRGLKNQLTEVQEEQEELGHEIEAIRSDVQELAPDPQEAQRADLAEIGAEIGREEGHCPLCGSEISEVDFTEHIEHIRTEISKRSQALAEKKIRIRELEERMVFLQSERDRFEEEIRRVDLVPPLQERLEELTQEAAALVGREEDPGAESLQRWAEQQQQISARLEKALRILESSRFTDQIDKLESEIAEMRNQSREMSVDLAAAEQATERATRSRHALERLERNLVDERLASLGPLLKECYRRLKPHPDWSDLEYHMRGDVKKFLSLSVGDDLNPRFMFSSGQRRAIGLAFLLSTYLGTTWSKLDTLLLDDPVQHVDDFRALQLVEVLSAIRKQGNQIIVSAEDLALADLFVRRLRGIGKAPGLSLELESAPGEGVRIKRHDEVRLLSIDLNLSA